MAGLGCTMSLTFVLVLQALTFTSAVILTQSAIISYLRDTSDPDVIPLSNNGRPVEVYLDLWIIKVIDVDRERNEIEVLMWLRQSWNNPALAWDVTKEGFNWSIVSIPSHYLWLPDITVDNVVKSLEVVAPSIADVYSDGAIKLFHQTRVRVSCDLQDVDSISGANCTLKCGSWTQPNRTVTVSARKNGIYTKGMVANPNYDLLAGSASKHSDEYFPGDFFEHIYLTFIVRKHDLSV